MQCRNCGTEIADKALICYKCGTATTEAKYQPAPLPAGTARSRSGLLWTVIAIVVLAAAVVYMEHVAGPGGDSSRVTYLAVGAAVIVIGIRAYARRR